MIIKIVAILSQFTKWAEMVRVHLDKIRRQKRDDATHDNPGAAADDYFRMRREDYTDKADS